jgi:hypothetical protein
MSHGLDLVVSARSAQRRLGSLARANEVRVERAHLKRALAAGSVAFAEVLANPPPPVRTLPKSETCCYPSLASALPRGTGRSRSVGLQPRRLLADSAIANAPR